MKNKKYYSDTPLLVGSLILGAISIIGITAWSYIYGNPRFERK
ncbi:hypothetical protein [Fructilactobacillus fructivorans]|uniref:Uncharacterized protein n=1 Tax=Fructilactobacillus fructivorans TaxID=1614 RepID=A0A0C1M042_9LACO|nr:hypothetical protein [Fructilactobacillus fructivorans]KID42490.1 hypothetical protein LfDm3_0419 [Fructilactobacillus fructivorans]